MKKIKSPTTIWFVVGFIAVLLAAPNGTIIKSVMGDLGPELFNVARFGIIVAVTLPFVLGAWKRFTRKNLRYALFMGVCMAAAVISYVVAVDRSQASYVAIIELLMPIIFIFYSMVLMREKISRRAAAGITLAALGAFIVVVVPIAFANQPEAFVIDPLATVMVLVNCLTFPLGIIFSRKAHEAGLPLMTTFGVSSIVVLFASLVMAMMWANWSSVSSIVQSPQVMMIVLYSALITSLLVRVMNVAVYQRVGSAAQGGFAYSESILSVIIPILVLGEQLSVEIVIGMALILSGLFVIESHHNWKHRRHLHGHGVTHR